MKWTSVDDERVRLYAAIFKAWDVFGGRSDVHPMEIIEQVKIVECNKTEYNTMSQVFFGIEYTWQFVINNSIPDGKTIVEFK